MHQMTGTWWKYERGKDPVEEGGTNHNKYRTQRHRHRESQFSQVEEDCHLIDCRLKGGYQIRHRNRCRGVLP